MAELTRPTIICVDDEPLVLEALSELLVERFGQECDVEAVSSGEEALAAMAALAAAGREMPVILCDQVMPGLRGDQVLEAVHRQHPRTLKVLLTGQAGLEAVVYAINNAGLNKYVEKPWETEALFLTVQGLLTQYRLTAEVEAQRRAIEGKNAHLEALHRTGLVLSSSFDIDFILRTLLETASSLEAGAEIEVFYAGSMTVNALSRWLPELARPAGLSSAQRSRVEQQLTALLGAPEPGVSVSSVLERLSETPPIRRWLPLQHQGQLLGLLVLPAGGPVDQQGLLSILGLQAATALHNIHLTQERIHYERLSAVGRMIGTLVHDLRNPITAARGYARMLGARELPDPLRIEYAQLALSECDRLATMADELLEFSRENRAALRRQWTTVTTYFEEIGKRLEAAFEGRPVRLELRLDYRGPVFLDFDKMTRAVLNVAANASQAMPGPGVFGVHSSIRDDSLVWEFSDTGCGIPASVQHRVFEPFFTYGKSQGIGLGTAIARKIVEEHGGRASLKSKEGAGTVVEFRLPLEPETAAQSLSAATAHRRARDAEESRSIA